MDKNRAYNFALGFAGWLQVKKIQFVFCCSKVLLYVNTTCIPSAIFWIVSAQAVD